MIYEFLSAFRITECLLYFPFDMPETDVKTKYWFFTFRQYETLKTNMDSQNNF